MFVDEMIRVKLAMQAAFKARGIPWYGGTMGGKRSRKKIRTLMTKALEAVEIMEGEVAAARDRADTPMARELLENAQLGLKRVRELLEKDIPIDEKHRHLRRLQQDTAHQAITHQIKVDVEAMRGRQNAYQIAAIVAALDKAKSEG